MTESADRPCVLVEDRGRVRIVTLNRPDKRNAIDMDLRVALAATIEAAMADAGVRAIVLTGAGGSFCSGGDVSTMRRMAPEAARGRAEAAQRVVRALWNGGKPVIAAVEGNASGAGVALALACDRVVAGRSAAFGLTFGQVGLAGDMGIFASLPDRVGAARARQMLMLKELVAGEELARAGLVDELVTDGAALDAALRSAEEFADAAPLALAAVKRLTRRPPQLWSEVLDREVEVQTALFGSDDFAEAVEALRERRPAVFTGK